jgi:hypothetical protein
MLEFDWLELFIYRVMEKKIPDTPVNYCLELYCCIKYMIFNLFIRIAYEKYSRIIPNVHNVN